MKTKNRRAGFWSALGGVILCVAGGASVAKTQEAPLLAVTFEENAAGWQGMGTTASAKVSTEAGAAKEGKGALLFEYAVKKGESNALLFPTAEGSLGKMKRLRFWIKSDHATPIAVTLQEKGGGRYMAMLACPKEAWQQVELSADDFILSDGKDDPKDPNNKLDADQIEAVTLVDFSQFFAQNEDPNFQKLFAVEVGARKIWLDHFEAYSSPSKETPAEKNSVNIDSFDRPQANWVFIGKAKLQMSKEKPFATQGLKFSYSVAQGSLAGLVRRFSTGKLTGKDNLGISLASSKKTKLLVQVEEKGGGKYNTMLELPGDSELREYALRFADFVRADDSQDANGKLDIDQVQQVILLDLSGLLEGANQDLDLWVGRVRATIAK